MVPTTDFTDGHSNMRRWGPIAAIVVVIAIIIAVVALGGGDNDEPPAEQVFPFELFCGSGTDISVSWGDGDMRLKCTRVLESSSGDSTSGASSRFEEPVNMSLDQACGTLQHGSYFPTIRTGALVCVLETQGDTES